MKLSLRMSASHYHTLWAHLFRGDEAEHGAIVLAGLATGRGGVRLLVREVIPARTGRDYVRTRRGHALTPAFIHPMITRARDERLVYLAVHNHLSTDIASFSEIDLDSHECGYPALLGIAEGMPVGALVMGAGAVEADLWLPGGARLSLAEAVVIGRTIERLYPRPPKIMNTAERTQDRQLRMFGAAGQHILRGSTVVVIGAGGIGSLVVEYLARLGVGHIIVIDPEKLDLTNLSRVVGSTRDDVEKEAYKVEVAKRHAGEAHPQPTVTAVNSDVPLEKVARSLTMADFIFLAADSMRARLVMNALVHQYLIPGVQLGSKVDGSMGEDGFDAWSAVRAVRPGDGCLWCNGFIERGILAKEALSNEERKAQGYGTDEPNPSVITLNAVAAAHGVNDFLFDYLGIRREDEVSYEHFHMVAKRPQRVMPTTSSSCTECRVAKGSRYAMGDARTLPTSATP